MNFRNSYFRAIDFQALLGNVGGYIGLILGYSILQMPDLVGLILSTGKIYFSRFTENKIKPNSTNFTTHVETISDNARTSNTLAGQATDESNDKTFSESTRASNSLSGQRRDESNDISCVITAIDQIYEIIKGFEERLGSLEKHN